MKPGANQKLSQFLLSLICFTAYIFFFIAVLAKTFNTPLYDFILGQSLL